VTGTSKEVPLPSNGGTDVETSLFDDVVENVVIVRF